MRLSHRQWALIGYFFPDGLGLRRGVHGRSSMGAADQVAVAEPAAGVSRLADLLAAFAAVGGARGGAASLAWVGGRAEPPRTAGLG